MSTLTRNALSSGEYLCKLGLPRDLAWSQEAIGQSLLETLKSRPPGPVWVFAYGSLMWNPLLQFAERQTAVLDGWHRSFCLRSIAGRGSVSVPGRMLALEPGGVTEGVALRLDEAQAREELRVLWTREMAAGSYRPAWVTVRLGDASSAQAITFVADPRHSQYESDASVAALVPIVAAAQGSFGTNLDYVRQLGAALADCGLSDDHVAGLLQALGALPLQGREAGTSSNY